MDSEPAAGGFEAGPAEGGETACWAHLVCQECGAMVSEGHRDGCSAAAVPPAGGEPPRR